MKKTILLFAVIILMGCSDKKVCPSCNGNGVLMIQGQFKTCLLCNGEKEVSEDKYDQFINLMNNQGFKNVRSGSTEQMASCPMCSGSGVFSDGFSSMTCKECNGSGQVTTQRAAQLHQALRQLDQMTGGGGFGGTSIQGSGSGNTNNYRQETNEVDRSCHSCNGSGNCGHCAGRGEVRYDGNYGQPGGIMDCPICKGTGRCGVCNGRGEI